MADSQKEVVYKPPDPGVMHQEFRHPPIVPPVVETPPPQKTVCGIPRIIFWLIVVIALLVVVVIGIAVGLGVGLTRGQNSQTTTSPSTTATVDSTSSSTTTTSASSAQVTSVSCPEDEKLETFEDDSHSYHIYCDSDFGKGRTELVSIVLPSFDKCLSLCHSMNSLQDRKDVGCTYNWRGVAGQDPGTCWCLGGSDKEVVRSEGRIIAQWK